MVEEARYPVQTVGRTFRIVEALKDLGEAGVTDIVERVDVGKSAVHNHLSTLVEHEYVVKEGTNYRLSLRFLDFGESTRNRMGIYSVAKPEVDDLAEETGELVNFVVEEHGRGIYLYRAEGPDAVQLDTYAGMRVHLHCTAVGKAMLAFRPRSEVADIVDRHGLSRVTDRTITDEETFYEALDKVRDEGVAFDDEERLKGLRCVAAPIKDDHGRSIGAISVSSPIHRMNDERFNSTIPDKVRGSANVIELNHTYS